MKSKIIFAVFAVMVCISRLNAQYSKFKPFKVDLAIGYAIPSGSGSKGGVAFAFEPKYSIDPNITLGIKLEAALTAYAFEQNGESFSGSIKATGSYLATGDYFFSDNDFRPFAGIGVGIFNVAGSDYNFEVYNLSTNDAAAAVKFGFTPRAGFEYGHFRLVADYNFAGKENGTNYNYLAIKMGFFFGGGRTKKRHSNQNKEIFIRN